MCTYGYIPKGKNKSGFCIAWLQQFNNKKNIMRFTNPQNQKQNCDAVESVFINQQEQIPYCCWFGRSSLLHAKSAAFSTPIHSSFSNRSRADWRIRARFALCSCGVREGWLEKNISLVMLLFPRVIGGIPRVEVGRMAAKRDLNVRSLPTWVRLRGVWLSLLLLDDFSCWLLIVYCFVCAMQREGVCDYAETKVVCPLSKIQNNPFVTFARGQCCPNRHKYLYTIKSSQDRSSLFRGKFECTPHIVYLYTSYHW